jgi:hypothetical protein
MSVQEFAGKPAPRGLPSPSIHLRGALRYSKYKCAGCIAGAAH